MEKKELTAEEIKEQFAAIVDQKWKRVENCKKILVYYGSESDKKALQEAKIEWIALFAAYREIFGEVVL